MISLDANILVYAADGDAGQHHTQARDTLRRASQSRAALTEQALFEFFHAATRKGKVSFEEAEATIEDLIQSFNLLLPSPTVVEDALVLRSRYRLGIWDARLLAFCNVHGCSHLLSEDLQDGARYGGVTVVNPFKSANAALVGQLLA